MTMTKSEDDEGVSGWTTESESGGTRRVDAKEEDRGK
jgi:hypothetical protein